jgi:signal peptidase II
MLVAERRIPWGWLTGSAILAFALDQVTKSWALTTLLEPLRVLTVTPFFNVVLGRNRGVSFGMLSADHAATPWILSALALAVIAGLIFWTRHDRRPLNSVAVGLITGGAFGNVVDRLRHGAVTDFLDFHASGYHWPTFNIADSAIFLGVALLLLLTLRHDEGRATASV